MTAFLRLLSLSLAVSSALISSAAVVKRQANNEVYQGNESEMTAANNVTLWVIPIKKSVAQKMVGNRKLLPTAGLQGYLHEDEHPLIVNPGYMTDIRQLDLRVDQYSTAPVDVSFVDCTGDGKTPCNKEIIVYADEVIPSLVGTLAGNNEIVPSVFDPPHAPYKSVGSGLYSTLVSVGVDNRVPVLGGPGYLHPVFQATFRRDSNPSISKETYLEIANMPQEKIAGNLCAPMKMLANYSTAEPFFVKADNLQTYPPTTPSDMQFQNRVQGISATVQWITPAGPGKPCKDFQGQ